MKSKITFFTLFLFQLAFCGEYLNSAHGSAVAGVFRININVIPNYNPARGNCAHCHEMHGKINDKVVVPQTASRPNYFALFAPNFNYEKKVGPYSISDDYCFYCHSSSSEGSVQISDGVNTFYTHTLNGIDNMLYSFTFGVADSYKLNVGNISADLTEVTSILSQFNLQSYHNLYDISVFIANKFECISPDDPNYPYYKSLILSTGEKVSYANPCSGCHNPHLVKRIKANTQNPSEYSVMSMPDEHKKLFEENMQDYINKYKNQVSYSDIIYQNPRAVDIGYEPAGILNPDPSKMPNYIDFCLKCHYDPGAVEENWISYSWGYVTYKKTNIYSNELGRYLINIDWSENGDKHGLARADVDSILWYDENGNGILDPGETALKTPYDDKSYTNINYGHYVVSCLDCHEPHGSYNNYLLRILANNNVLSSDEYITDKFSYGYQISYNSYCSFCHKSDNYYTQSEIVIDSNGTTVLATSSSWKFIHHYLNNAPFPGPPRGCGWCHGSFGGRGTCTGCHIHSSVIYINNEPYKGF